MESSDQAVQATAEDALVSKISSVRLGYYTDPFIELFGSSQDFRKRPPLINRGYWARVHKFRDVVAQFWQNFPAGNIVSIGAGLDTTYWNIREQFPTVTYVEADFIDVTRKKSQIIAQYGSLSIPDAEEQEGTLTSQYYKLIPVDLRDAPATIQQLSEVWDTEKPTLMMAECVMIYMEAEDSDAVIQAMSERFSNLAFITYEMIEPNDPFGRVMVENIQARGCPLKGIFKYPTLESQRTRYSQWFSGVTAADLLSIYQRHWDPLERSRIEKIEWFDEFEEWELIQKHYYIALAIKGSVLNTIALQMDYLLIAINLVYFLACSTYSILAPFYPIVAKDKGFGESFIGLVIAIYPLVGILTSAFLTTLILKYGRKELMFIGGIIEVVSVALFAFTIYMDGGLFATISIISRMGMGVGGSIILTSSYAVLAFNYQNDNLTAKIGVLETFGQIGLLLGPVIASAIYGLVDYVGTFLLFAAFLLAGVLLLAKYQGIEGNNEHNEKELSVPQCKIACYPQVLTVLFFVIIGLSGPVYLEAVSAIQLDSLGVDNKYIGLVFALQTVGFLVANIFFGFSTKYDKRVVMVIGAWIMVFGLFTIGPIWASEHVAWTLAGQFIIGAGSALSFLPALPYMLKVADKKFEEYNRADINDSLAAIFGTCHYIGESFGPLYAGIFTQAIGFTWAAGLFGILILAYSGFFGWYSEFFKVLCSGHCMDDENPLDEPLLEKSAGDSEDTLGATDAPSESDS